MKLRFTKAGNLEAALAVDAELKQLGSSVPTPQPTTPSVTPSGNPIAAQAPAKTVVRGDYEYILVDTKVTWEEARAECIKMGGELASFESLQEWERIARLLVPPTVDPAVWVGAFRPKDASGPWEWSDGTPFPKKVLIGLAEQVHRNAIRAGVNDGGFTADASRFHRGFLCKKKK